MLTLMDYPHKRLNLLTGEWVLVSPQRSKRPWQGKVEELVPDGKPEYDVHCYLCPGNKRYGNAVNPSYQGTYVFTNDFGALEEDTPKLILTEKELLKAKTERGICKVIVFSNKHHLSLPELSEQELLNVIETWAQESAILSSLPHIKNVQLFENKGAIMGCSNPHPHGQIWAQTSIPQEIIKETKRQKMFFSKHGKSLLRAYLQLELEKKERIVEENDHFVALVPFWAVWPYETMLISRRHLQWTQQFTQTEKKSLASILRNITTRYDNLFSTSFPYSAGIHQAPVNNGLQEEWHWHMHFYPPLLRSAGIKKFMVGYEMLANPQRDITAEWAAEKLRSMELKHYKLKTDF